MSKKMQKNGAEAVTVLLADDDPLVRGVLRQILVLAGYRLLEATTGDEAWRCAEQHQGPIHLLLTDVVMPGMNGRRLAELVMSARQETRVLFMSGYTDDVVLRQGVRDGSLPFIQKPFLPDSLLSKMREVLEVGIAAPASREAV